MVFDNHTTMIIIDLKERQDFNDNIKLKNIYLQFNQLLGEIRKKKLPDTVIAYINEEVKGLNSLSTEEQLKTALKLKQKNILKLLEKQFKITPKNYYRNIWMVLGMSAFGLPIGVAIGTSIGNIGLLGVGLPIGMAIGLAVGAGMDKKALKEGRQLEIEIK